MSIAEARPGQKFLTGVFASVHDELDVVDLPVSGTIPAALEGAYLRNGANPQFDPLGAYHWFDGDGMIHAVTLSEGRASYRNRFVETPGLLREREAGRALFGGISNVVLPPEDLMAECGVFKNAANTNIIRHAGRILALWEGGFPTELTEKLDTVGLWDMDGRLTGAFTAHPKWDARTGELMFFGYSAMSRPFLRYHVADRDGVLTHSVDIDLPHGVMMHDFLTTERYSIFFDLPAVVELEHMMSGQSVWQPGFGARIGVLPRHGGAGEVRWFEIEPCYVFHFLNAWEEEGRLVLIGCRMPSIDLDFDSSGTDPMSDDSGVGLTRWTIDLAAGTCREEQLSSGVQDFPRVADPLVGYPTRYGHVSASLDRAQLGAFDAVIQYDRRGGVRRRPRGPRRAGRLAAHLRDRQGHRRHGPADPRRPRHHRGSGPGASAPEDPAGLPRQLVARRRPQRPQLSRSGGLAPPEDRRPLLHEGRPGLAGVVGREVHRLRRSLGGQRLGEGRGARVVQELFGERQGERRPGGQLGHQVGHGRLELVGGVHSGDESHLGCGGRIDDVARQAEQLGPLEADQPGYEPGSAEVG
jgi:carotenoid cleavage dioxygenase